MPMLEWIRQKNIAVFRRLLATKIDAQQRHVLVQLLKQEQAKEPSLEK
jgi:hypothetical protein